MKRLVISLFSMAMVLCLFICGISIIYDQRNVSFNEEKVTFLTDGWFYESQGLKKYFKVPNIIPASQGEVFEIYNTFQKSITAGSCLGFRSSQQEIYVSLNDEEIYSYVKADDVYTFPKSPASAWHIIELPKIHSGQILKISSLSPYRFYQGNINTIMLGSKSAILFHIATQYFPAFCVTIMVLILAVSLILYGIYTYKIRHSANFIYLGMFALLLGIWFFGDSKFTQFFFGNIPLPYQMVFLSIALIPIPALLFFSNVLQPKNKRLYEFFCIGSIVNFFIMVIAQTIGWIDFYQWLPISHFIIFLGMLLVSYTLVEFNRKYTYKKIKFLFYGVSVFIFLGIINIFYFYTVDQQDNIFFLQIGTLLALIIIAKGELNKNIELIQIGFEAAVFKKAAYTDALTKIGNRYAFDLLLEKVENKEPKENIENAICIIDVDGLKFTNDNYGHRMGDQLICSMAECLKSVFDGRGKYFRIGGDEFAVILTGEREELQGYLTALKEAIDTNNKNCQCSLSASWGMAFQSETEKNSIYDAFQLADTLMYQDKERKKGRYNFARRLEEDITIKD